MTANAILQGLPNTAAFFAALAAMELLFFVGFSIHRGPAIFLFLAILTIGAVATPNVFPPPPPIQLPVLLSLGLALSVLWGVIANRLKGRPARRGTAVIYALSWGLSTTLFFFALLFSVNAGLPPALYAVLYNPFLLCASAGLALCLALNRLCGNFRRKLIFAAAWPVVSALVFGAVVLQRDRYCRLQLWDYSQSRAISDVRDILRAQMEFRENCSVDRDHNQIGEFAFLSELTGDREVKNRPEDTGVRLDSFHKTSVPGVYEKNFHLYAVYLVTRDGFATDGDRREDPATEQERWFACIAWPALSGRETLKTLVALENGEIYYSGTEHRGLAMVPRAQALFARGADDRIVFLPSQKTDPPWQKKD